MNDVYGSLPLDLTQTQRRAFGRIVLGVSAVLFIGSVLAGTTNFFGGFGMNWWESRQLAGVLGGIALPLIISGVFLLLPSSKAERQLATTGITIALTGTFLFWYYYPSHWNGYGHDMTFAVVGIYFIGAFTSFAALFFAVSNVKINTPGGVIFKTVKESAQTVLDTTNDTTHTTSNTPPQSAQNSGVGFMGDVPTADANDPDRMDDAIILGDDKQNNPRKIDEYCGNCEHFSYRQVSGERRPYCGMHDELMDDLEACDEWTPQNEQPATSTR